MNLSTCDICGTTELAIVESRSTRGGMNRVNPVWRPDVRQYELCRSCGVKYLLEEGRRV